MKKRVKFNDDPVASIHEIERVNQKTGAKKLTWKRLKMGDTIDITEYDSKRDFFEKESDEVDFAESVNSLRSDISDDSKGVMDIKMLTGQEGETIRLDGDITITPFNLEDEMNEGHFDKAGNFIFDKKNPDNTDAWLDSIEWDNANFVTEVHHNVSNEHEEDVTDDLETEKTILMCLQELSGIIKENETVLQSIKRLGKASKGSNEDFVRFEKVTECADILLNMGIVGSYDMTRAEINKRIKCLNENGSGSNEDVILDGKTEGIDCDILRTAKESDFQANPKFGDVVNLNNEVMWEYKWDNLESSVVYGPFPSKQMLNWKNEGYFDSEIFCRKHGDSNSEFYSSSRIDFDLYTNDP